MDDRAALFANVLSDPGDDTARLVLADWLDEHGEGTLARFLRAGLVAARFRDEPLIDDPAYFFALADLAEVTTAGAPAAWLADLGIGPVPLTTGDWVWDNTSDQVTVRVGAVSGVFARGLLAELMAPLSDWYALAPRAFAKWPLESGTVTDVPGLRIGIGPPAAGRAGWLLSATLTLTLTLTRRRRQALLQYQQATGVPFPVPPQWGAEREFPTRGALAERLAPASAELVDELRGAAGTLWPAPPRPRS